MAQEKQVVRRAFFKWSDLSEFMAEDVNLELHEVDADIHLARFGKLLADAESEGFTNITLKVVRDYESINFYLIGDRLETDAEFNARLAAEAKRLENLVKRKEKLENKLAAVTKQLEEYEH